MPITRIAISAQRFAQWHARISIDLQQALDNLTSVVNASRLQYQTQRQRHPALFAKLL